MPMNRALYPPDWEAISRRTRFERARGRCERCGAEHGAWGWRDDAGQFHKVPKRPLLAAGFGRPPFRVATSDEGVIRIIEIVLTVAHLDHDPSNCDESNLKALCQACHLRYDAPRKADERKYGKGVGQELLF